MPGFLVRNHASTVDFTLCCQRHGFSLAVVTQHAWPAGGVACFERPESDLQYLGLVAASALEQEPQALLLLVATADEKAGQTGHEQAGVFLLAGPPGDLVLFVLDMVLYTYTPKYLYTFDVWCKWEPLELFLFWRYSIKHDTAQWSWLATWWVTMVALALICLRHAPGEEPVNSVTMTVRTMQWGPCQSDHQQLLGMQFASLGACNLMCEGLGDDRCMSSVNLCYSEE